MTSIKDRILQISEFKGINKEIFFENLGFSYGNFKGKSKKSALNSDAIAEIATKYTDINLEWLLTGKGEMLKQTGITQSTESGINIGGSISNYRDIRNYTGLSNNELIAILEDRFRYVLQKEEDVRNTLQENRDLIRKAMQQSDEYYKLNAHSMEQGKLIDELKERIKELEFELLKLNK